MRGERSSRISEKRLIRATALLDISFLLRSVTPKWLPLRMKLCRFRHSSEIRCTVAVRVDGLLEVLQLLARGKVIRDHREERTDSFCGIKNVTSRKLLNNLRQLLGFRSVVLAQISRRARYRPDIVRGRAIKGARNRWLSRNRSGILAPQANDQLEDQLGVPTCVSLFLSAGSAFSRVNLQAYSRCECAACPEPRRFRPAPRTRNRTA